MTWEELVEKAEKIGYSTFEYKNSKYQILIKDYDQEFWPDGKVILGAGEIDGWTRYDRTYDQMYQIMLALED
jgi:hypothetical protein